VVDPEGFKAKSPRRSQARVSGRDGPPPRGKFVSPCGSKQPGGKIVHAWAVEENWKFESNMFAVQWPPRSGRQQSFPQLNRAAWFNSADARAY
jgi:predicted NUDIX family NTP pyrophosphohydrolase